MVGLLRHRAISLGAQKSVGSSDLNIGFSRFSKNPSLNKDGAISAWNHGRNCDHIQ